MANKSSLITSVNTNTANNVFFTIWLLTRMMKAAGWSFMAGSAGNTTTTTIAGGSITFPQGVVTVAATTSYPTQGSFTVAGVTGTVSYTGVSGSTFTGCTGGTGTVTTGAVVTPAKTTNNVSANDPWGGNADPTLDAYPIILDTHSGWIVFQRLSTVKLACSSNATGTFTRGEQVTQATSGATGECKGFVFDTVGANGGWMVIAPRTGTFDGTHVVTGAISAATFTPTSTKSYYQEIVFWKATDVTNGNAYYICLDGTAENAQLYSVLATSAGCTTTVAPGGGGTGNTFPTLGLCVRGNGGSASFTTWFYTAVTDNTAHTNAVALNATAGSSVSADGSFWVAQPSSQANNPFYFMGFFALDHAEPGDVDPYAWRWMPGVAVVSWVRTVSTSFISAAVETWGDYLSITTVGWTGYCARGTGGATDIPAAFLVSIEREDSSSAPLVANVTDQVREQCHPSATKPLILTDFCIYNTVTGQQQRKGRPRWLRFCSVGNQLDTVGSKSWLVLVSQSSTTNPAILVGPWDGSTVPVV